MNSKTIKLCAFVAVCLTMIVTARGQSSQKQESAGDRLSVSQVRDYRKMFRVNEKPMDMAEQTKVLCSAPTTIYGPHYDPGVVYYINQIARQSLGTYSANRLFPVGSIIVKEKQERRTEDSVQIITVMKKVKSGNAEDSWEYKMYDTKKWTEIDASDPRTVVGHKTCINCHRRYEKKNYRSREGITLLLGGDPQRDFRTPTR